MQNQVGKSIAQKSIVAKASNSIRPSPTKEVTFVLSAYLAELIEETRSQLGGQWEELLAAGAELEHDSFDSCAKNFEALFVDAAWSFEGAEDRSRFTAPLRVALGKAFDRHRAAGCGSATRAEVVP